ncbi:hypothetical protein [uncultured Sphingomonas sp.]|uniref:hypothetical protein n=1 Tax=uncultured Sphingomonas sp. TaxID=158754 RepID=UPI0025F1B8A2|nr:hypothetical protein [uncultured Sphingomonas sp.]
MPQQERVVAVGLLTERDLRALGQSFKRAYPLEQNYEFQDLLTAIDHADRDYRTGAKTAAS